MSSFLDFLDDPPGASVSASAAAAPLLADGGHAVGAVGQGVAAGRQRRAGKGRGKGRGKGGGNTLMSLKGVVQRYNMALKAHRSQLAATAKSLGVRRKHKVVVQKLPRRSGGFATHTLALAPRQHSSKVEATAYTMAAFMTPPNIRAAAAQLDIDDRTLRRMRSVASSYVMSSQLLVLGQLIAMAEVYPPLFIVTREAWDETTQECQFRTSPDQTKTEARGRWEVMVCRVTVCLGWSADSGRRPMVMHFVIPPVVIPTTSAANMYWSLRRHPSFMSFNASLHMLRSRCQLKAYILETDAAYSNEKLIAFFIGNVPAGNDHFILWKCCHSHKNNHIETMMLATVDTRILSSMYSMIKFLASGAHWPRLLRSLTSWAAAQSEHVPRTPPSEASRKLGQSIIAYAEHTRQQIWAHTDSGRKHVRWQHGWGRGGVAKRRQRMARTVAMKQEGFRTFMMDTYNCLDRSESVHHCTGASCCPRGALSLQSRLAAGMKAHVLPRLPAAPIASKWTTLAPVLDALGMPVLLRAWPSIFRNAFAALKTDTEGGKGLLEGDEAAGEIDWVKLTGRRKEKSVKFINDEDSCIGLILLMICLEPTRWLTEFFTMCASDEIKVGRPPRILNILLPTRSRLTRVMQYLSKLYFDDFIEGSRGWLLTAWLEFPSEAEHQARHPVSWMRLRVALRATMAYIWRKHVLEFSGWPWKLLKLADERTGIAEKDAIAKEFDSTPECCLPHGMTRTLKAANADVRCPRIREFLYWVAFLLRMTVADVETRHARNNNTSSAKAGAKNTSFTTIATAYVAAEYASLRRSSLKA